MTKTTHLKPEMRKGAVRIATMLCAALALTAAPQDAAASGKKSDLWKDIGASERIDLSGRVHMLSQRIAASTCMLEAGIEPTVSKGILAGSADEMDRIKNALEFGNPLMKVIGAETDQRVLNVIRSVNAKWTPIRDEITDLQTVGYGGEDLSVFTEWNIPFFDDANLLVSEISAQYSNPADLLQRDAILVDLAGRQRMRTQMMLKQACEIWTGKIGGDVLAETVNLFDVTLDALLNGEASFGISAAPTAEIEATLTAVNKDWAWVQPMLQKVVRGNTLDEDQTTELYLGLNEMLIKSDGIVTKYTKHAKHAKNAF